MKTLISALLLSASLVAQVPAPVRSTSPPAGITGNQGNGAKLQLSTGTTTTNDCVKYDANGNTVDAGSACLTGPGSSTNNYVPQWNGTGGTARLKQCLRAGVSDAECGELDRSGKPEIRIIMKPAVTQ